MFNLFKKKINKKELMIVFLTTVKEEITKGNILDLGLEKKVLDLFKKSIYKLSENQVFDITGAVHLVCLDSNLQEQIKSLDGLSEDLVLKIEDQFISHGIYFD